MEVTFPFVENEGLSFSKENFSLFSFLLLPCFPVFCKICCTIVRIIEVTANTNTKWIKQNHEKYETYLKVALNMGTLFIKVKKISANVAKANNGNMLQSGVHRPSSAYESSFAKHEQLR